MSRESEYMRAALEKIGCVVLVSSISQAASLNRRKVEYISPNAGIFGINADMISQGYRLIDDYVHPDDRQRFNEAVTMSLSGSKNFSYEVRNIGDDGIIRRLNVDIIHLPDGENDGVKYLEFILREITDPVLETDNNSMINNVEIDDFDIKINSEFFQNSTVGEIIDNFASLCELYSVVLDINGHVLVNPTGPAPYLGEFFETVRNPQYKELYFDVVNCIVDSKQSMYSEIDDGNPDSRFAAAPLFLNGRFCATWLLYAHNKAQNQKLFKAFDRQAALSRMLSDVMTDLYIGSRVTDEEESIRSELEFERQSKKVTEDIIQVIAHGDKTYISDLYERVGRLLDVDYMVYYAIDFDRPGKMNLIDYWAKGGKSKEAEEAFIWDSDHYNIELQEKIKNDCLIVDKNNMTNRMRVEIFRGNARAVMVFPLFENSLYVGRLIFIENSKERVWQKQEIDFAQDVAEMISRDISIEKRIKTMSGGSDVVREIFEDIPVMILIRNVESGKIIYANAAIRNKLGADVVGQNSYIMIPKVTDKYESFESSSGRTEQKTFKYKRYIDKLDGIYDVRETFINWTDKEEASILVIIPE